MKLYIIEIDGFTKVGISKNIHHRLATYKNIKQKFIISGDADTLTFLEALIINHYSSDVEYLTEGFDDVVQMSLKIFATINLEYFDIPDVGSFVKCQNNGYVFSEDFHSNKKYVKDYIRNDSSRQFIKILNDKDSMSVVTKVGKYGNTYFHPLCFLDYLMWSSNSLKYKILRWMYTDTATYARFTKISNKACYISISEQVSA